MADAIPVSKPSRKPKEEPAVVTTREGGKTAAELLAYAQDLVANEAPARILDEQVNQIGQATAYGKIKAVSEIEYRVKDEDTGKSVLRSAIRIDH